MTNLGNTINIYILLTLFNSQRRKNNNRRIFLGEKYENDLKKINILIISYMGKDPDSFMVT